MPIRIAPPRSSPSNPSQVSTIAAFLTTVLLALACTPSSAEQALRLADYALDEKHARQLTLPKRIREISGLATAADGRLFGHDDERAVIYEIDLREEKLLKAFAMGDPIVSGDFEGIAIAGDRFYLTTSAGELYSSEEGSDGERMPFERVAVDVGRHCEVEGLAYESADETLLLACKEPRGKKNAARSQIHRWSLGDRKVDASSALDVSQKALAKGVPGKRFHISGLEVHPGSGHYFLISGPERAIAEVTPEGEVVAVRELSDSLHRQVEGIAFDSERALVLADEGGGRRARITRYKR